MYIVHSELSSSNLVYCSVNNVKICKKIGHSLALPQYCLMLIVLALAVIVLLSFFCFAFSLGTITV